jgi:hypothetical protein
MSSHSRAAFVISARSDSHTVSQRHDGNGGSPLNANHHPRRRPGMDGVHRAHAHGGRARREREWLAEHRTLDGLLGALAIGWDDDSDSDRTHACSQHRCSCRRWSRWWRRCRPRRSGRRAICRRGAQVQTQRRRRDGSEAAQAQRGRCQGKRERAARRSQRVLDHLGPCCCCYPDRSRLRLLRGLRCSGRVGSSRRGRSRERGAGCWCQLHRLRERPSCQRGHGLCHRPSQRHSRQQQ